MELMKVFFVGGDIRGQKKRVNPLALPVRFVIMVKLKKHGGRSQVVKAVDCGSTTRGFESHRPPSKEPLI